MRHVYWVIDHLLAGRPGPILQPWDPAELYAGGLKAVVSLAAEESIENLTPYGFTHCRANFPPVTLFSRSMQKAFIYQALPVWAFIHEQLAMGHPTMVHCHAGQDRTGAILAGYLIVYHNEPPDQALRRLRDAKPAAMTAEGFAEVLVLLKPGIIPDSRTLL
jgi:hypothetical protein